MPAIVFDAIVMFEMYTFADIESFFVVLYNISVALVFVLMMGNGGEAC